MRILNIEALTLVYEISIYTLAILLSFDVKEKIITTGIPFSN